MTITLQNPASYKKVSLDSGNILVESNRLKGVLLYLDYTKGSESEYKLTPYIRTDRNPEAPNTFYLVTQRDVGTGQLFPFEINLTVSGLYIAGIVTPQSTTELKIVPNFAGGSGTLKVFVDYESPYRQTNQY